MKYRTLEVRVFGGRRGFVRCGVKGDSADIRPIASDGLGGGEPVTSPRRRSSGRGTRTCERVATCRSDEQ